MSIGIIYYLRVFPVYLIFRKYITVKKVTLSDFTVFC